MAEHKGRSTTPRRSGRDRRSGIDTRQTRSGEQRESGDLGKTDDRVRIAALLAPSRPRLFVRGFESACLFRNLKLHYPYFASSWLAKNVNSYFADCSFHITSWCFASFCMKPSRCRRSGANRNRFP